jgi:hypothetical protein
MKISVIFATLCRNSEDMLLILAILEKNKRIGNSDDPETILKVI